MNFNIFTLTVITLVGSLLLSSSSPLLIKTVSAQSLSCTVDIIKVADGYSLPYKNDGYYLDNSLARLLPGDTFIYSFKLFTGDSQQQGRIQKVTAQQIQSSNEPISILAADTVQGAACNVDSDKKVTCNLDYSFTGDSYNPVYLLMKADKQPAYTKTSTLFSIETDLGTTMSSTPFRRHGV